MKRLLSWTFNGVSVLSAVLFVATCGLWLAARHVQRQFARYHATLEGAGVWEHAVWVGWDRGGVAVVAQDARHVNGHGPLGRFGEVTEPHLPPPPTAEDVRNARAQYENSSRAQPGPSSETVDIAGSRLVYDDWHGDFFNSDFPDSDRGRYVASRVRIRRASAPFYLLAPAVGLPALAAVSARLWRRARRRRRAGVCPSCGYDLRATPEPGGALLGRCPECGATP